MDTKLSQFYRGKHVLVTGGAGFIGSNLAIELVQLGARVTALDGFIKDYGANLFNLEPVHNKVTLVRMDLRDEKKLPRVVRNQDIIFNLAGTLSHVDSMADPHTDLAMNCVAQLNLLEACRKHNPAVKILFAGTRNQYGRAQKLPVTEDHPQIPIDINGINSIAGEQYHLMYHRVYGIKTTSLRLTNTYGPRHQMKHPRQGVLNWFLRQLIEGKQVTLYGTGKQIRDTNYVDDVVGAFLLAGASAKVWGQAYNLGGDHISLKDFVKTAMQVLGRGSYRTAPFPKDRAPIEIGDYIADWRKIHKTLGWKPRVLLEEGIARTFKYYQQNKKHYWL
ncbi:GDP-mannose 4,6-dehydratase [Candidatus Berkelbacteria bacterium]|nr:GDP-mannose 4,6-dehydratase [Candidatus Berkelbacteria bacterium]